MSIYTVTFLITMFVILITAVDVKTNRLIFKDNQYEIYTVCIVIFTTRLLNRRCIKRNTENMKSPACVLFFDVNNFKSINDTFGHSEGDNCLSAVASKIMSVYGRFGYCYRIGRDEFCVMIHKNLDALMR